jgi:phosphohistidine swiveling domain-containing protein
MHLRIQGLMERDGVIEVSTEDLLQYCSRAIAARELGKFTFTKIVSLILERVAEIGEKFDLDRGYMSHLEIMDVVELERPEGLRGSSDLLISISDLNKWKHEVCSALRLPQVLFDIAGIYVIPFQASFPNFVSHRRVEAPLVFIDSSSTSTNVTGKIVLIENADPGYDWLFAKGMVGLITKYGGANSHMAIRCAELRLPAAIGCGEQKFQDLVGCHGVMLDTSAGLIVGRQ